MSDSRDSAPVDFDPAHKDAKLLRWVMRKVATELRDDPSFMGPIHVQQAEQIIKHLFNMFVRWVGITVLIAAVGGALILLGALGNFPKWFGH